MDAHLITYCTLTTLSHSLSVHTPLSKLHGQEYAVFEFLLTTEGLDPINVQGDVGIDTYWLYGALISL